MAHRRKTWRKLRKLRKDGKARRKPARTETKGPQEVAEAVTGNRHEEAEAPGEDEQIPEDVVDEVGIEAGEATIPTTIPTTSPPATSTTILLDRTPAVIAMTPHTPNIDSPTQIGTRTVPP